jgi:hypothetical protein
MESRAGSSNRSPRFGGARGGANDALSFRPGVRQLFFPDSGYLFEFPFNPRGPAGFYPILLIVRELPAFNSPESLLRTSQQPRGAVMTVHGLS